SIVACAETIIRDKGTNRTSLINLYANIVAERFPFWIPHVATYVQCVRRPDEVEPIPISLSFRARNVVLTGAVINSNFGDYLAWDNYLNVQLLVPSPSEVEFVGLAKRHEQRSFTCGIAPFGYRVERDADNRPRLRIDDT